MLAPQSQQRQYNRQHLTMWRNTRNVGISVRLFVATTRNGLSVKTFLAYKPQSSCGSNLISEGSKLTYVCVRCMCVYVVCVCVRRIIIYFSALIQVYENLQNASECESYPYVVEYMYIDAQVLRLW